MTGIIAQNVGRTSGLIKATAGGGTWTKIKELTASASATISFVDGTSDVVLDSTYPIYLFKFINIHPPADDGDITFQGNAAGGSGYNETITSTYFRAYNNEADDATALQYLASKDQAQETGFQIMAQGLGNDNDQSCSGELWLFNPSSTTFVKNFCSAFNSYEGGDFSINHYMSGYFNTTSAIDEIQFKMASGNIDAGIIKLYGLGDS